MTYEAYIKIKRINDAKIQILNEKIESCKEEKKRIMTNPNYELSEFVPFEQEMRACHKQLDVYRKNTAAAKNAWQGPNTKKNQRKEKQKREKERNEFSFPKRNSYKVSPGFYLGAGNRPYQGGACSPR